MFFETKRGPAVRHGGRVLVPVGRTWGLRVPWSRAAFVWNRPLGVEVEGPGEQRFLPVPDRTRGIQWALLGLGAAVFLLSRFLRKR
ncbi:MAG TPA: hypothetical protein VKG01_14355 [Thermoanaerobaculia bacterium]|nr:hypothetical protein [Thermoanaerobaculia bacterium]